MAVPTLAEAEAAVGEPAAKWVARCYEIAYKLVDAGAVEGRAVYGHYLGPVLPGSVFHDRHRSCGFTGHGWVSLPDGRVLDPTRWVFEAVAPYLYIGDAEGASSSEHGGAPLEYDEGGNVWRERNLAPPPPFQPTVSRVELNLPQEASDHIYILLGGSPGVTVEQLLWLSNLPLARLGEHARAVFQAIVEAGHAGFLPIDNRRLVLGTA